MCKLTKTQPINCKNDVHTILLGITRIFDFVQVINQPGSLDADEIDFKALNSDWEALGRDMRLSMKAVMEP